MFIFHDTRARSLNCESTADDMSAATFTADATADFTAAKETGILNHFQESPRESVENHRTR